MQFRMALRWPALLREVAGEHIRLTCGRTVRTLVFMAVSLLCLPVLCAETTPATEVTPVVASGTKSSPIEAGAANAIAVADFELADAPPDARDWAFGMADVLAVELQQRGVVLFERQQIRVVLGERRITASGLSQLRRNPHQAIPDVQYLVTGSMRPLTNQQFHLEASLVEARTGRNAASFARDGRYPEEMPGALASLADQLVWRNHFPIRHPLFGQDRDLRQAVTEWKSRIHPVQYAHGKEMALEQLEVMLTQARQVPDKEARPRRVEFLQRLIEHKQSNPELYQGRDDDQSKRCRPYLVGGPRNCAWKSV